MPFGRNGTASNIRRFWRPFLTAEPFICAALNQPSNFARRYEDFIGVGRRPQPPLPPPVKKKANVSQHVKHLLRWFNKNS